MPYWLADGIRGRLDDLDTNPAATLHSVFDMDRHFPTSLKRAAKARLDAKTKTELYGKVSLLMVDGINKTDAIKRVIVDMPIEFRTAFKWFNEVQLQQQKYLRALRGVRLHKLR